MTDNQRSRITKARAETIKALARAERYSPQFRDTKLIAEYCAHIAKLDGMLAGTVPLPA